MGLILETELSPLTKKIKDEIKNYILSNFSLPFTPKKSELLPYLMNDKKSFKPAPKSTLRGLPRELIV